MSGIKVFKKKGLGFFEGVLRSVSFSSRGVRKRLSPISNPNLIL
jgi:hypothetical protein